MGLGTTWWHGSIVTRQDSYVVDEGHPRRKDSFEAWEASAAWDRKRWELERQGTEWLERGGPEVVASGDDTVLLIAVALILMD